MLPSVQTLILIGMLLLGSGYVILGILALMPRFQNFAREAWPILMTETLIVGTVAVAVWIDGLILDAALLVLALRCKWEAARVAGITHPAATWSAMQIAGGVTLAAFVASFVPIGVLSVLTVIAIAVVIYLKYFSNFQAEANVVFLLDLALFPGLPLILFIAAGLQGNHGSILVVAYILVEIFDSYALAGGKLFGRTRAFPKLSPRKTVEGLAIGAVALMLTAALGGMIFGLPLLGSMAVGLLAGMLAVTGDLAASALKRRSAVKDYPAILPHQGGLLDIADAWIVTGAGLVALAALTGLG